MDFNLIKTFIDKLLNDEFLTINSKNTKGIIFDFIGGEPFLEIDIINQTIEYVLIQLIKLKHPWVYFIRFSICSNGVLYFNKNVQTLFKKYNQLIGFTISIDGDKELHDSCRIDFNGNGSYDKAMSAVKHYRKTYNLSLPTKMTLSPKNLNFFILL